MTRPKVLIIDDNATDAHAMRRYLSHEENVEYTVMVADNGEYGLDLLSGFRPDVVLLDFDLPDIDGLEYLREFPARIAEDERPIVLAVTGQSDPRVAADLIRAGAEDYISKSEMTEESIRFAVRQAVRTRSLRVSLMERARERELSREELVKALKRASTVASFSEALSRSLEFDDVLRAVADLAVPQLGDVCFVDISEQGHLRRQYVRANGAFASLQTEGSQRGASVDAYEGAAKVIRSGVPARYARSWLTALARWDSDIERALCLGELESALVVPLMFDDTGIGALTLLSRHKLDNYAQDTAIELGRRASAALSHARAFQAERDAKRLSDDARKRLNLLSQVSELLSRSLEWRTVFREVVELLAPASADFVSIALLEGGTMQTVASSTDLQPMRPAPEPRTRTVPGQSEFYPDVHLMRRYSGGSRALRSVTDTTDGSFIRVPIFGTGGDAIGALVLSTEARRRLSADDLELAEELGRRIGMYLENARLFEREREIARSLQRSLLPSELPMVPGVLFAAHCMSGGSDLDVGGDWYDIIPLPRGQVGFAVGDVAGRGVLAAASMGQLRSSLRAYMVEGLGPADALSRLNAFMLSQEKMEFATVAVGVLHCATGHVRFSSAGHLPPLVVDANDGAHLRDVPSALPVGIVGDGRFIETEFDLRPGQALALYTDGLVETRSGDIDDATSRLRETLSQEPVNADTLLQRAMEHVPAQRADDVTCLVVHYAGVGTAEIDERLPHVVLTLPAIPSSAAKVRVELQRFCAALHLDADRTFDLQLSVGEAVANAVEHAYEASQQQSIFSVHARREAGRIRIDVLDQGRWRDGVRTPRGQLSERGRGVGLMRALCDEVRIERTLVGTRIQLALKLNDTGLVEDDVTA